MPDFYIVNRAPVIEAANAGDAAEAYAKENGLEAGVVIVAAAVKKFDVTTTPATIAVRPQS